jgi:hypothetical protein
VTGGVTAKEKLSLQDAKYRQVAKKKGFFVFLVLLGGTWRLGVKGFLLPKAACTPLFPLDKIL